MLTTREIIKTLYNALIQRMKKHRGNWEQNDPAADDYIKNRPFYTDDSKKVVIVPNQQITFSDNNAILALSEIIEFVVGQSYEVKWDDVNYTCVAWDLNGHAVIGNQGMIGKPINTGEPFIIIISKAEGMGAIMSLTTTGTHTVEVTASAKIVKIDKKYLPDFAPVATSGSYDDLTDTPTLATVAMSGSYNDLTNKPTIYSDVVRYNVGQSLNIAQKIQARANIGAASLDDITGVVKYSTTQSLTDAQKEVARTNIGAGTSSFSGSYNDLTDNPPVEDEFTPLSLEKGEWARVDKEYAFTYNNVAFYKIATTSTNLYNKKFELRLKGTVAGYPNFIQFLTFEIPSDGEHYNAGSPYYLCYFSNIITYSGTIGGKSYYATYRMAYSSSGKTIFVGITNATSCSFDSLEALSLSIGRYIDPDFIHPTIARTSQIPAVDPTLSIEGDAADAKAVGDAVTQLTEQKADKSELENAVTQLTEQKADKSELEKLNTPKNYIILIDQVSGVKYRIAVRDGSIVSYIHIEGITVTSAPAKTTYMAGEYFDSTGLVISTVSSDGSTVEVSEFVVDETYVNTYLTEDVTEIGISYTDESGEVYTTTVPITVTPFDPSVALVDFEYTANGNGTYTITEWKETLNGESSTEMIIPNNGLIIV